MDKWYRIVRELQDKSEDKYQTRIICEEIFSQLLNGRIREKQKFKNRMGPEFEQWVTSLNDKFTNRLVPKDLVTKELVQEIIQKIIHDEEFWEQTLILTLHV